MTAYDDWGGGPVWQQASRPTSTGGDNLNVGTPNSVRDPARTVKLTVPATRSDPAASCA